MKTSKGLLSIACLIVAVAGCTQNITTTPTVIVDNHSGGNPVVSPSAGPGSGAQVVFGEKAAEFGEVCPSGGTPAETSQRETRVGCNSAVTCSPTDVDGAELKGLTSKQVQLVAFRQLGGTGAGKFSQGDDNPYNGTVTCTATGVVVLECSLKDVASGIVTTGGDGGNRAAPWSMNCVS